MESKEEFKTEQLHVASLFAGVGGICQGFKNAGFNVLWANEVDKNACETYRLNHKTTHLFEKSIEALSKEELNKIGKINVLTAGFPCQPFSLAGHRKGFNDPRGHLFFNFVEILNWLQPQVYLLENVKNIVTHDNGKTFKIIENSMNESGYSFIPFVLKASDYSKIPQARERVYIVGFKDEAHISYNDTRRNELSNKFISPAQVNESLPLKTFLDKSTVIDSDYYNKDTDIHLKVRAAVTEPDTLYQYRRYYVRENKSKMCPTLTANMGMGGHNVPILLDDEYPRRLTPKECFNLQGFPESFKLPDNVVKSQLYKQAGNSVVVPIIESIGKEIKRVMDL